MKPKPERASCCLGHSGLPEQITLRRLQVGDCLNQLTDMLHRAFSRLGEMGLPCSCVNQTPEITRNRIADGVCFVAVTGEHIVGTITLYPPDVNSASNHYRDVRIASARQLAVDPQFQGVGVGMALLRLAEDWARCEGYARLALDTPEPAAHLVAYYLRQGFRMEESLQFPGRAYRSVVFAKTLLYSVATDRAPSSQSGRGISLTVVPTTNRRIQPLRSATRGPNPTRGKP